jgi:hypothetical protein
LSAASGKIGGIVFVIAAHERILNFMIALHRMASAAVALPSI